MKIKRIFAAVFALITLLSLVSCSKENISAAENKIDYVQISAQEAKQIMDSDEDCVILDVRTLDEFNEKHIPGAVLIPDYEITARAEKELTDKNQQILVYCRSGRRSKNAAAALASMGYTNVKEFGGINDWPYETVSE